MKTRRQQLHINHTNGFTLLEIMLALSIAALSTLLAIESFSLVMKARERSQAQTIMMDQGKFILRHITQDVRNASAVASPNTGFPDTSLTLSTNNPATNPTVFTVSGGILTATEGAGTNIALSSEPVEVTGLTVQNTGNTGTAGSVLIEISLSYHGSGSDRPILAETTLRTSATVRDITP